MTWIAEAFELDSESYISKEENNQALSDQS